MYSGQNILQNFNETPYQYTPGSNVPNIKIEREDDYENAVEDEGGYDQYGYNDSDVSHNIQPEIIHSTPNNVQNKLSAADKLKNFFLHEGIRLPRGTEILLAPSSSGDSGHDNGNPSAPLDHYQADGNSQQPKYEKNYPCSLCDKAFSTELFLATHLRLHTLESLPEHQLNLERELDAQKETLGANSNTFVCPVCEKSFNMKRYLSNHLRSHNMKLVESDPNFDGQTQTYTCNQCQKSYTKKASFIAHMKAHDDRPYKCDVCSRLFKEVNSLNVHKSLHSSNSKHQCNVCGLFFKFRSQLKIHEWTHSNNKFTCKFCAKIFRNYFSCKSHENNHINGKQFICCFCEKTFKYKVALKTHLITHTRPYKCDCCNRTFDTSLKLENHRKTHLFEKFQLNISEGGTEPETCIKVEPSELTDYDTVGSEGEHVQSQGYDMKSEHTTVDDCLVENVKLHFLEGGVNDLSEANSTDKSGEYVEQSSTVLYSCQGCQMDFKFLEEYQGHMASHQSNVNLNCKHCGQPFKRYKKLEKHLRKHNEYKCERCIKSFETEAELLQHTIYHKDESFKCNYCDSMFTNKYTLQYHIKRHLKRYRCKYCPKSFDNEAQLETHINTHQSVYKCDYCEKDFKFQSLLSNHLKIHTRPFKCDKCDRSFDKSTMLSRHERNVHAAAPFVCHFCDRTFSYESTFNTHLRSHNRQYQCVYCMRSFDDQARYEKHVKRHEMQYTDLQCDKCDKKFKYKSQLQLHIKNHKNLYRCEQCQIQMKHWKSYEKHKKLVHGDGAAEAPEGSLAKPTEEAFKCDKCDKKFKYNSQLLLHVKQHKNVHRCDQCEMQFKHWKSYQKHVRSVHEEKQEHEEFACTQCEAKFRYQSQLKYHLESHNRKYACHCGKTFNSHKYFKSHQNSHTEGGLKCDFCAKEFRYYSELKLHAKKHLKECTFQCYHCERHFQTKAKLQRHIEVIHMRAPKSEFKCESCDKTFKYLSQLKTHSNLHERLYKCKLCDRSFNNKRYYIFHMNKHQNINLSCQQCGKTFPYYSKLQIHMKSHATAKRTMRKKCSWNCNLCGKRFKFQSLLKNHMKIHEGVKPYQCDYCGKRFAWKSSLQIHSSFVHKHKTNFHCESCDRYFFYESQYKQHMATCSWHVSFNCERCDKQLKSRKTYELHLLKHEGARQFTCAYCDKGFYAKQVLVNHIKNHMEKETQTCPICGQQFTSQYRYNIHVDTHSVEFRCSVCDRVFKCKYKLKRHVMTVHQRHATYSCEHCGKLFLREGALINHQAVHFGKQSGYEHSPMFGHVLDNFVAEEEVDVKPDIPELGILVPEVIYENHF